MISAGRLDQRITIQRKQLEKNGVGDSVTTYADVCTIWAEVIPLRGAAFFAANQQQHTVDVRFRFRVMPGIDASMRVLWQNQPYDITAIIPGTAQYLGTLEIMAVSGVRDGK